MDTCCPTIYRIKFTYTSTKTPKDIVSSYCINTGNLCSLCITDYINMQIYFLANLIVVFKLNKILIERFWKLLKKGNKILSLNNSLKNSLSYKRESVQIFAVHNQNTKSNFQATVMTHRFKSYFYYYILEGFISSFRKRYLLPFMEGTVVRTVIWLAISFI